MDVTKTNAEAPAKRGMRAVRNEVSRKTTVPTAAHGLSTGDVDRRVTRSRKALREALIRLMEERSYEAATVNDLCSYADLNRGTFYNHYRDKDDLLLTLENEIIESVGRFARAMRETSLKTLLACKVTRTPVPFLVDLFDYLRLEGDFLHAVMGEGGDVRFAPRLRDAVCRDLILAVLHDRYRDDPTPFVNYYVSFYASAYLGVIQRWIETGMEETSEDMARIAMRLLFISPGESIEL